MPAQFRSPQFLAKLGHLARTAKKVLSGEVSLDQRGGRGKGGSGTLFQEHRTYTPGDDPRSVDWNIYGRLGELFVKVFEPEGGNSIHIYLDCSPSMQGGAKDSLAAQLAAAFGYIGLVDLAGIRVIPFPARQAFEFHGQADVFPFLHCLENLPTPAKEDLAGAFRRGGFPSQRTGTLTIFISDFFPSATLEKTLAMAGQGPVLCLHVVDPQELRPGLEGSVQFEDMETENSSWILVTSRVRERYEQMIQAHLREVALIASQRGAAYYRASTAIPFDVSVLEILTRGMLPRRGHR